MVKGPLGLPHIRKTEFVYYVIAERPGVAQVPLLKTLFAAGAEAGDVGPGCLEIVKGIERVFVRKVVVGAEILLGVDVVIETKCRLVRTVAAGKNGLEES